MSGRPGQRPCYRIPSQEMNLSIRWSGSQEEDDDKKDREIKKKLWVQVYGGDEAFQGNARKKISLGSQTQGM